MCFLQQICCKFVAFLKLFCSKNAENDYFDQRLECAAPKCWSKYTTPPQEKYFYRLQVHANCWFDLALQHRALRNLMTHRWSALLAPSASKGWALGQRHVVLHPCKNQRVGMEWVWPQLKSLDWAWAKMLSWNKKFCNQKYFRPKNSNGWGQRGEGFI